MADDDALHLLDPGDAGWPDVVSRMPHDVYHLPGYSLASQTYEADLVRLAVVECGAEALAAPVIVRPLPGSLPGAAGLHDITAPYGYPSPICTSADAETQDRLFRRFLDAMRSRGFVSAFMRCNPFTGLADDVVRRSADVVTHGEFVIVDIAQVPDSASSAFRAGHRADVKRLLEQGFSMRLDDHAHVEAFPDLYRARMRAVGADPYYLFPDAYFRTLFESLGEHARLVGVVDGEGRLAAAAIVLVCGEFAHYHLASTHESFMRAAPMKLAVLGMIELCRAAGVKRLNLGSGLGGRKDSLFDFKAGFSAGRAPFGSARVVLDPARYDALSGGGGAGDYFPAYRSGY